MSFTGFLSTWTEWIFPRDKTKSHIFLCVGPGIRRLEGILAGAQSLGFGMLCVFLGDKELIPGRNIPVLKDCAVDT